MDDELNGTESPRASSGSSSSSPSRQSNGAISKTGRRKDETELPNLYDNETMSTSGGLLDVNDESLFELHRAVYENNVKRVIGLCSKKGRTDLARKDKHGKAK